MKNLNEVELQLGLFNLKDECLVDCDTYASSIIDAIGLPIKMINTGYNNHEVLIAEPYQLWCFTQHPNSHMFIV